MRFDFLFVYVMNTSDGLLCLPSWHHGNHRKLSSKRHGMLLLDLWGNPVYGDEIIRSVCLSFATFTEISPVMFIECSVRQVNVAVWRGGMVTTVRRMTSRSLAVSPTPRQRTSVT